MKFFLIIFLATSCMLSLLPACSDSQVNTPVIQTANVDTFYAASTVALKSNHIPDSVFRMTRLRHLVVTGMDCDYGDYEHCWGITEIPPAIKNLTDLVSLRLTVDAIGKIPVELMELKNLKILDLTDNNGLGEYENLSKCHSLEYLYLYGCGLSRLPPDIGELTNLKDLGLVGNHFSKEEQERIKKALPNCKIRF